MVTTTHWGAEEKVEQFPKPKGAHKPNYWGSEVRQNYTKKKQIVNFYTLSNLVPGLKNLGINFVGKRVKLLLSKVLCK